MCVRVNNLRDVLDLLSLRLSAAVGLLLLIRNVQLFPNKKRHVSVLSLVITHGQVQLCNTKLLR